MTLIEAVSQTLEDPEHQRNQSLEWRKIELFELFIEDMVSYLLEGSVNPNITQGLEIDGQKGLSYNTALKIRFLLDEEVVAFLKELGTYLRSIRTEVARKTELRKGEVRGRIDWATTIQIWASSGFQDKTSLIVDKPVRNYDIPENLVLKKTVMLLNGLMNDEQAKEEISRNNNWNAKLKAGIAHVQEVLKNVYFKRIAEKNIIITSRMKTQVRLSRKKLYRDSCKILEKYQTVFDRHEISQLLKDTFIDPNNIDRTYELACLFRIIRVLEKIPGWEIEKLGEIKAHRNETAVLKQKEKNYKVSVFYNVTIPAKVEFKDRSEPKQIRNALRKITSAYFGEKKERTRIPDIIIEFAQGKVVKDYIIFEVKYTEDIEYVVDGIYQALHYLFDLRRKSRRVFFSGNLGKGYNAGVVAYGLNLPQNCDRTSRLEDENLAVKLFDISDLRNSRTLEMFFNKFLEQHCSL